MTGEILHLGVGNFHRAHQAWYTQHANLAADEDWRITGVSLRSPAIRDQLAPQGFDYTLAIKDAGGAAYEKITAIDTILFAPDQRDAVLEAIARADIVTLTITEKGYCLDANGRLDLSHPAIQQDLSAPPTSVLGLLAQGLADRETPATIISCDNLSGNGRLLGRALSDFASAKGLTLPTELCTPNTMVDRITPATTEALSAEVAAENLPARAPVETEGFSEWVIEDSFTGPRPAWERAGARIVEDAAPYEARKLRMLNGAHSALAYAGVMAGYEYVHEAVADPKLRGLVEGIFDEAAGTLSDGIDTERYRIELLARFANPNLNHGLRQIAMDGSQKLPVRLLATIHDRPQAPGCRQAVDAWMSFVIAEHAAGRALDDPRAAEITQACEGSAPRSALARLIGYET